eukprot:6197595-Pleurochrysis_carterae.AAC.1
MHEQQRVGSYLESGHVARHRQQGRCDGRRGAAGDRPCADAPSSRERAPAQEVMESKTNGARRTHRERPKISHD